MGAKDSRVCPPSQFLRRFSRGHLDSILQLVESINRNYIARLQTLNCGRFPSVMPTEIVCIATV